MKTNPGIRIILASLLLAGAASAAPITGHIAIVGFGDPTFSFNTVLDTVTFGAGANAIVSAVSGSYATPLLIPPLTAIHYNSFSYAGTPGALVVTPLWTTMTAGLASFNLSSISTVAEIPGTSLTLTGSGTAMLSGFDNTVGNWSFTATRASTGATTAVFGWDSLNTPRVPDGGATLALLGMSVLGLGGVRRFLPALKK